MYLRFIITVTATFKQRSGIVNTWFLNREGEKAPNGRGEKPYMFVSNLGVNWLREFANRLLDCLL